MFLYKILKISFITFLIMIAHFVIQGQGYDFYWIGGTGYWSDTLSWESDTTGLPSQFDNVIFDENSFKNNDETMFIDIPAQCNNMDWSNVTNEPTWAGSSSIEIFGSVTLASQMIINFNGDIQLLSDGPSNQINTYNKILNSDIYFLGDGTWNLSDILSVGLNHIYFQSGALNTHGWSISCGSFYALSEDSKVIKLNSSSIIISAYNGVWDVDENLTVIKDDCIIIFENDDFTSKNVFSGGGHEYCEVVFENDAIINDNNTFVILYFNAGHTYKLQSNTVQTIENKIVARGCAGLIHIEASGANQATIAKENGGIDVFFVSLYSINAELGNGLFNADYSIDLGNNSGNLLINEDSRDMHWVNGTGYWSDTIHWSSMQGGMDDDCLPLVFDNLFFDENSFNDVDTVYANIPEIACNDMIWTGNDQPVLINSIPIVSLTISGSLEFSPLMDNKLNGPSYFYSETSNSIVTSDIGFGGDVTFEGVSAGWIVSDSLKIDGNLNFYSGSLNLTGNYMKCNTFHSDSAFLRTISLGDADIIIKSSSPYPAWRLNNENLQFDAGFSNIDFLTNSSTLFNYGGDTVEYNDIHFIGEKGTSSIYTYVNSIADTYAKFNAVHFGSNGYIRGSNSFDTLSFSAGNAYSLEAGKTQIVNHHISTADTCTGTSLLQSLTTGQQAFIQKPEDTLSISHLAIQDIHVLGNATYIAQNSIDLFNNIGWDTIMGFGTRNLYWVGGSGSWEDPLHWDLVSNGPGGVCIPTPADTVVFDNFSFTESDQKVEINYNNAFARNLIWDNVQFNPEFAGTNASSYLRIYGSLQLDSSISFTYPGIILFGSRNKNEFIKTSGINFHNVNNHVYFQGDGGEWELQDSLNLGKDICNQNNIYFNYGDLITHGHPISCFSFSSQTSGNRKLSMDTSNINLCNSWYVYGTNLEIPENGSVIKLDSGTFSHRNGTGFYYNDLLLNHDSHKQQMNLSFVDSIFFNNIKFNGNGQIDSRSSTVYADSILFKGSGRITDTLSGTSIYVIDTLIFNSTGEVFGNDTISFARFDSTGLIQGDGVYNKLDFSTDGSVFGNNKFDTLLLTPAYHYIFEEFAIQTISDSLRILGNNCEFVYLDSSGDSLAKIKKDTGSIFGDFIEMKNIMAIGNAQFDAGNFSVDVDNSNVGWDFHTSPSNYQLPADTSVLEGDIIIICPDNFNGDETTTYMWQNESGEVVGEDSCLMVSDNSSYTLTVFYEDGPGCSKQDEIVIGCFLDITEIPTHISCYDFQDGNIELIPEVGTEPFDISWYDDQNNIIGNGHNLQNIPAGEYHYTIVDVKQCISEDTILLTQPDTLELSFIKMDACYQMNNGTITLNVKGGTEPYTYLWNDNNVSYDRTELAPGDYSVTMQDAFCPAIDQNIEIVALPEITFDLESSDLICYQDSSGSIYTSNVLGGIGTYSSFIWKKDNNFFDSIQNIEKLSVGHYLLTVIDDIGCLSEKSTIINEPDKIILSLEQDTTTFDWLGSVNLTVVGGIEPYGYLWSNGETTQDINSLEGRWYTVEVEDAHACLAKSSIYVEVRFEIYAPTAFSPNGDGLNDEFRLVNLGTNLTSFDLAIYNRWGETVFSTSQPDFHWNGRLNNNGEELSLDVYTWHATIEFTDHDKIIEKGNITLIR